MKRFKKLLNRPLGIAVANLAMLTLLLAIWTDKLVIALNHFVRPAGFLVILGISLLAWGVIYFGRKIHERLAPHAHARQKVLLSWVLCLLVSAVLYLDYLPKATRRLFNRDRHSLLSKTHPFPDYPLGARIEHLTRNEYEQLQGSNIYLTLPPSATDISLTFSYDGFLPDYLLIVSFDLPAGIPIEEYDCRDGRFHESQQITRTGDWQHVVYEEGRI